MLARVRISCILSSSDEELSTSLPLSSLLKDLELVSLFEPETEDLSSDEWPEEEDRERPLLSEEPCEEDSLSL